MAIIGMATLKVALITAGTVAGATAVAGAVFLTRPGNEQTDFEEPSSETSISFDVQTWTGAGEPGPGNGETVDGPLAQARLASPTGLAADELGNVYVSDVVANVIRKIDEAGNVTTVAGSGKQGFRDGPAAEAEFNSPNGIAVGPDGSLYVADSGNHRIRRLTPAGHVETVAGGGPSGLGQGTFVDGPVAEARFSLPKGIAVAPDGTIFVADTDNLRIRMIAEGAVSTYAGTGVHGAKDGDRLAATFANVLGLFLAHDGSLYIADQPNSLIRRIDPSGQTTTVARDLRFPASLTVTGEGLVVVADTGNQRIVAFDKSGKVVAAAGSGAQGFADGRDHDARFFNPTSVLETPIGILIADSDNHRVRVLEVTQ